MLSRHALPPRLAVDISHACHSIAPNARELHNMQAGNKKGKPVAQFHLGATWLAQNTQVINVCAQPRQYPQHRQLPKAPPQLSPQLHPGSAISTSTQAVDLREASQAPGLQAYLGRTQAHSHIYLTYVPDVHPTQVCTMHICHTAHSHRGSAHAYSTPIGQAQTHVLHVPPTCPGAKAKGNGE